MESGKILITGISGYIASITAKHILDQGGYTIRGTVRDKNNAAKIEPLKQAFGEHFNSIELVNADLTKPETLDAAIEGCDYVLHIASPYPGAEPKDPNTVIKPAVEGTLEVLKRCHKY